MKRDHIEQLAGWIPSSVVSRCLSIVEDPEASFGDLLAHLREHVILAGFSATQFIEQFLDALVMAPGLQDQQKALVLRYLGHADYALNTMADERLQLEAVAGRLWHSARLCNRAGLVVEIN